MKSELKILVGGENGSRCSLNLEAETVGEQRILDLFVHRGEAESNSVYHETEIKLNLKAEFHGHMSHNRVKSIRIDFDAGDRG